MKAKPRGKSSGLARVGKVILGAALLAVDQLREKLSETAGEPQPKPKRAAAKTAVAAKSSKAAPRKKPASKRATAKTEKPEKKAATPPKSTRGKKST